MAQVRTARRKSKAILQAQHYSQNLMAETFEVPPAPSCRAGRDLRGGMYQPRAQKYPRTLREEEQVMDDSLQLAFDKFRMILLRAHNLQVNCPKDPAVLKILRRSKFARRSKFTIA